MGIKPACEVCGGTLRSGLAPWHRRCQECGLETGAFTTHIDDRGVEDIDEDARELALRPIREANFDTLLGWLLARPRFRDSCTPPRLLDVGCAHGWFLEKAAPHFEVTGIEPDPEVFSRTAARGLTVRRGYFPDVLQDGETFDVIVFNDVLEHIPDVISVLRECNKRLRDGGVVVVNAPDRRGMLYRIAHMMARVGFPGTFDRMWQKGMPSPHLYYFDTASLSAAARGAGLSIDGTLRLPSLFARGLYSRIRYSGDVSRAKALLIAAGVLPLIPALRVLPSDITVWALTRGP
jgi:SAM-dependent methyltransferase